MVDMSNLLLSISMIILKYHTAIGYCPGKCLLSMLLMTLLYVFRCIKKQKELLAKDPALSRYYYEDVVPSLNLFIDIELEGIPIDWERVGL